jgi:hypothetical protein
MLQKTKNYEMFSLLENNRTVAMPRIKAMVKSINENGYFMSRPIIVSPNMEIIDGQSRFLALKQLNLEIPYCIETADPTQMMFTLNKIQSQWQFKDYVNSFAVAGSKFYKKIAEVAEIKSLQTSNAIGIVSGQKVESSRIKKGEELPINPNCDEIVKFLLESSQFLPYWKTHSFVMAVMVMFKKTNEKQRQLILNKIPSLPQQVGKTDYLFAFENILNKYKKQESEKIKLAIK